LDGDRVAIVNLHISPNRKLVSYVLDQYRGSFVGSSKGYVLMLNKENEDPILLGRSVYGPLRWSSDSSEVYGAVGGEGEEIVIVKWKISDL